MNTNQHENLLYKELSYLRILLVVISSVFVFFSVSPPVEAAMLYMFPQSQTVYEGDTFIADVRLNTEGQDINAVGGNLQFPSAVLNVVDISRGGSLLTLWPEDPSFSNSEGTISFIGGVGGGFKGDGLLARITFRAEATGFGQVRFEDSSKVLLHDGQGTEAALEFSEGDYGVSGKREGLPVITAQFHPDQNAWYRRDEVYFHWDTKEGAAYSYLLSRDPLAEPDEKLDKPIQDIKYEGTGEGIFYFSLRELSSATQTWGPSIHYRVMIDRTSPDPFELQIVEIEGKQYAAFSTTDAISGIDHYEVQEAKPGGFFKRIVSRIQEDEWKEAESPYLLENQSLGGIIRVQAIDKAGNKQAAQIQPPYRFGITDILSVVLLVAGFLIIVWIIRKIVLKF